MLLAFSPLIPLGAAGIGLIVASRVAELVIPGGIPRDPFLDAPIHRKRTADGGVIYSVGNDRGDNGGTFDRQHAATRAVDVSVTLHDPDRRRRPAEPKPQP